MRKKKFFYEEKNVIPLSHHSVTALPKGEPFQPPTSGGGGASLRATERVQKRPLPKQWSFDAI
jgi:hypothetical protein